VDSSPIVNKSVNPDVDPVELANTYNLALQEVSNFLPEAVFCGFSSGIFPLLLDLFGLPKDGYVIITVIQQTLGIQIHW